MLPLMSLPSTGQWEGYEDYYYQIFFQGWIDHSLSVNSKIRKPNGPSSRSREAVICSWPSSPACTKSSTTDVLIQLAGIPAHPSLCLLAGCRVWESGMLSLIISQSSGKPELYMDVVVERVRMTASQWLWNPCLFLVMVNALKRLYRCFRNIQFTAFFFLFLLSITISLSCYHDNILRSALALLDICTMNLCAYLLNWM